MGFLDNKSRVIDFVLTERGRRLYADGELEFSFFALFDDGIDYDPEMPAWATDDDLDVVVGDLPMLEVNTVPQGSDSPASPLFQASPDYEVIPHLSTPIPDQQFDLSCRQTRVTDGYLRGASNVVEVKPTVTGEISGPSEGFIIRVFTTGSQPVELAPKRDLFGRVCFDPFLSVAIDSDPLVDPKVK